MRTTRNYAALPHEYIDEMAELTDEEFGHLVRGLLRYSMTGELLEPKGNERFYARRVMMQEDRFQASYNELTAKRSEAGRKGAESRWHSKASLPYGSDGNTETETKIKPNNTTLPRSTERRNKAAAAAQTERMRKDMEAVVRITQGGAEK